MTHSLGALKQTGVTLFKKLNTLFNNHRRFLSDFGSYSNLMCEKIELDLMSVLAQASKIMNINEKNEIICHLIYLEIP